MKINYIANLHKYINEHSVMRNEAIKNKSATQTHTYIHTNIKKQKSSK